MSEENKDAARFDDGPLTARVRANWVLAIEGYKNGDDTDFYEENAFAMIQDFERGLYTDDVLGRADLRDARQLHMERSKYYASLVARRDFYLEQLRLVEGRLTTAALAMNQFVFQTLCLSNGAIVLAVLGLIGNKGSEAVTHGMLGVLVLCSIGFGAAMASGHAAVVLITPATNHLIAAMSPWIPVAQRDAQIKKFSSKIRWQWASRILGYISFLCLAAAVYFGAKGLVEWPIKIPPT